MGGTNSTGEKERGYSTAESSGADSEPGTPIDFIRAELSAAKKKISGKSVHSSSVDEKTESVVDRMESKGAARHLDSSNAGNGECDLKMTDAKDLTTSGGKSFQEDGEKHGVSTTVERGGDRSVITKYDGKRGVTAEAKVTEEKDVFEKRNQQPEQEAAGKKKEECIRNDEGRNGTDEDKRGITEGTEKLKESSKVTEAEKENESRRNIHLTKETKADSFKQDEDNDDKTESSGTTASKTIPVEVVQTKKANSTIKEKKTDEGTDLGEKGNGSQFDGRIYATGDMNDGFDREHEVKVEERRKHGEYKLNKDSGGEDGEKEGVKETEVEARKTTPIEGKQEGGCGENKRDSDMNLGREIEENKIVDREEAVEVRKGVCGDGKTQEETQEFRGEKAEENDIGRKQHEENATYDKVTEQEADSKEERVTAAASTIGRGHAERERTEDENKATGGIEKDDLNDENGENIEKVVKVKEARKGKEDTENARNECDIQEKDVEKGKGVEDNGKGVENDLHGEGEERERKDSEDLNRKCSLLSQEDGDTTRRSSIDSRWKLGRKLGQGVSNTLDMDQCDPPTCVGLLRTPSPKIYSSLNRKLKACDQSWMKGFLEESGLDALLTSINAISSRKLQLADAMMLLECVACVKTVMNSKIGLQVITERQEYAEILLAGK